MEKKPVSYTHLCLAAALLAAFLQKGEGSFLPALLLAVSGVLLVLFAGFERSLSLIHI